VFAYVVTCLYIYYEVVLKVHKKKKSAKKEKHLTTNMCTNHQSTP